MNRDDEPDGRTPQGYDNVGRTPLGYDLVGITPKWIMQIGTHVPEHERTRSVPPNHSVSSLIGNLKRGEALVMLKQQETGFTDGDGI